MHQTKKELLTYLQRSDLLRAALIVGKIEDANFNMDEAIHKMCELCESIFSKIKNISDPIELIKIINHVLFQEEGLIGLSELQPNLIDDPRQYYLHHVLRSKKGSSVSLAIIYMTVAQVVGLKGTCICFPSNFFVKVIDSGIEFYIHPYEGGRFYNNKEFQKKFRIAVNRSRLVSTHLYEELTPASLTSKLLHKLKHVYVIKGEVHKALRAIELLTALYPEVPELKRDRGILYCEIEYFSQGLKDLRTYLKLKPKAEDVKEIKKLASMLKNYCETVN